MRILGRLLELTCAAALTAAGTGLLFALLVVWPQPVQHIAYFAAFGLIGCGLVWIARRVNGEIAAQ